MRRDRYEGAEYYFAQSLRNSDLQDPNSREFLRLRAEQAETERNALRRMAKEEVWYWQGDGHDDLESLTCPVLMQPETLRALLAERDAARVALGRAVAVLESVQSELGDQVAHWRRAGYELDSTPYPQLRAMLQNVDAVLADPLGQQAAQEWQRLRELADAMLAWDKLNATYQRAVDESNYGIAEAVVTDWGASWDRVVAALAALQQPPSAGKGQQG